MAFVVADRVKETSTSLGTGDFALAGAMTGFKTFASRCAVGDTLYYAIQGVDGTGTPTAEWECGLGTYSSANTLTRTTVTASSNADTAVNFSAGTKQVYITMPAVQVAWVRDRLTADRTYYVRTDGNDSNSGLSNTAGGAFLTIQKAVDVVSVLDLGINAVTIQLADGTYSGTVTVAGPWHGFGTVTIKGNITTPANTVCTSSGITVYVKNGGTIYLDSVKMTSTGSFCLLASMTGVAYCANVDFGTCASRQMQADDNGVIRFTSAYKISASSPIHMQATSGGIIRAGGITVTLTGTPDFSTAFASALLSGVILANSSTYSGAATGKRYTSVSNGIIDTAGGGATYFPGDSAHATPTATGGQYL